MITLLGLSELAERGVEPICIQDSDVCAEAPALDKCSSCLVVTWMRACPLRSSRSRF